MDWRLHDVFNSERVNQTALGQQLKKDGWAKNETRGLIKKVIASRKPEKFFKLVDASDWYAMYRRYLGVSPKALTGLETDEEVVTWLVNYKLKSIATSPVISAIAVELTIDPSQFEPVSQGVRDNYINIPYRRNGGADPLD